MNPLQLIALVGLLCILYACFLVGRSMHNGEDPTSHYNARKLVGVWMTLALVLEVAVLIWG